MDLAVISIQDELESFFKRNDILFESLSRKEEWLIQQKWREVFAINVKAKTGKWNYRGNDWHAFSYNFTQCLKGAKAVEAFNKRRFASFYFFTSNDAVPAFKCVCIELLTTGHFIDLLTDIPKLDDLYLFSINYEWTMVIVHEPNIGPFFAEIFHRSLRDR
jgi:hypothetical protein